VFGTIQTVSSGNQRTDDAGTCDGDLKPQEKVQCR
jgi:hypothetical protein